MCLYVFMCNNLYVFILFSCFFMLHELMFLFLYSTIIASTTTTTTNYVFNNLFVCRFMFFLIFLMCIRNQYPLKKSLKKRTLLDKSREMRKDKKWSLNDDKGKKMKNGGD